MAYLMGALLHSQGTFRILVAKHPHGSVFRNSEGWKVCADRSRDVERREVGVVLFPSSELSECLRLDNAHWHAAHGKRRSANGKDWKLTAGEMQVRTHASARRRC